MATAMRDSSFASRKAKLRYIFDTFEEPPPTHEQKEANTRRARQK
jgi:hypothetical protein